MPANAGEIKAKLTVETADFHARMKKAREDVDNLATRSHRLNQAIRATGVAFGVAGAGIAVAIGAAIKVGMDFEAQIDRVGAIAGATGDELEALKKTAMDLGASTSKSASEVAIGMEQMAAAGFEVNEIISAMPGVIAAAEASGEDMARVTEVVTAALNGFGLEASEAARVADIMAEAANRSAASVDDFGYAFKYAAPLAKQLGIEIEDLAAMVMVMADAGIEGSQAGTSLRMSLQRLADPPKSARDAIAALGVSFTDANGKMKPTRQLLADIIEAMQRLDGDTRTAAASAIFGTEAMSGMLNVIEAGPEKLKELANALRNSEGVAQETAQKMKDNLKGSIEELGGAVETASIKLTDGMSPALRAVVRDLTAWINKLSEDGTIEIWGRRLGNLIDTLREVDWAMVGTIAKFTAGAAPVALLGAKILDLTKGLGNVTKGLGNAASGAGKFSGLLSGLAALAPRLMGFLGPYGWLIAGLSVLAGLWMTTAGRVDTYTKQIQKMNVATAESTVKTDQMVDRFEELRKKAGMSYDEIGRYLDLQTRLKRETDPSKQKQLAEEIEKVKKSSGLSNAEFDEMIRLNNHLAKTMPLSTNKITEHGNAVANATDRLKQYNAQQRELIQSRLWQQATNGARSLATWLQEINKYQQQYTQHLNRSNQLTETVQQTTREIAELEQRIHDARQSGNIKLASQLEEQVRAKRVALDYTAKLADQEWEQAQKALQSADASRKKVKNLLNVYDQLKRILLLQHGINDAELASSKAIEKEISANNKTISQLEKKRDQHGANKKKIDEQIKALEKENSTLKKILPEMKNIEEQQNAVNRRVDEGTQKANKLNKTLSKKEKKHVDTSDIANAQKKTDQLNRDISATKKKPVNKKDIDAAYLAAGTLNSTIEATKKKRVDQSDLKSAQRTADSLNSTIGRKITKYVDVVINFFQRVFGGGKKHHGGIVDAPKFHDGGVASLERLRSRASAALPAWQGGVVPGFGESNAVLLGGEMVLTRHQQAKLWNRINALESAETGGVHIGSINVTLQGSGYTREDAYRIAEHVQEEIQRQAKRHQRARGRR